MNQEGSQSLTKGQTRTPRQPKTPIGRNLELKQFAKTRDHASSSVPRQQDGEFQQQGPSDEERRLAFRFEQLVRETKQALQFLSTLQQKAASDNSRVMDVAPNTKTKTDKLRLTVQQFRQIDTVHLGSLDRTQQFAHQLTDILCNTKTRQDEDALLRLQSDIAEEIAFHLEQRQLLKAEPETDKGILLANRSFVSLCNDLVQSFEAHRTDASNTTEKLAEDLEATQKELAGVKQELLLFRDAIQEKNEERRRSRYHNSNIQYYINESKAKQAASVPKPPDTRQEKGPASIDKQINSLTGSTEKFWSESGQNSLSSSRGKQSNVLTRSGGAESGFVAGPSHSESSDFSASVFSLSAKQSSSSAVGDEKATLPPLLSTHLRQIAPQLQTTDIVAAVAKAHQNNALMQSMRKEIQDLVGERAFHVLSALVSSSQSLEATERLESEQKQRTQLEESVKELRMMVADREQIIDRLESGYDSAQANMLESAKLEEREILEQSQQYRDDLARTANLLQETRLRANSQLLDVKQESESQLQIMKRGKEALEIQLKAKETSLLKVQADNKELVENLSVVREEAIASAAEYQKKLSEREKEVASLKISLSTFSNDINDLRQQVRAISLEKETMARQSQEVSQSLETSRAEVHRLHQEKLSILMEKQSLQQQVDVARQESRLSAENAEHLRSKLERETEQSASLMNRLTHLEIAMQQAESYKKQLGDVSNALKAAQSEVDSLRGASEALRSLKSQNDRLSEDTERLSEELRIANMCLAERRKQIRTDQENWSREKSALETKLREFENGVTSRQQALKGHQDELQTQRQEVEKQQQFVAEVTAMMNSRLQLQLELLDLCPEDASPSKQTWSSGGGKASPVKLKKKQGQTDMDWDKTEKRWTQLQDELQSKNEKLLQMSKDLQKQQNVTKKRTSGSLHSPPHAPRKEDHSAEDVVPAIPETESFAVALAREMAAMKETYEQRLEQNADEVRRLKSQIAELSKNRGDNSKPV